MAGDMFGRGAYEAGSDAEFKNFGLADFDRVSNEGITAGGWDTDYLGELLGGQGGQGSNMGMSALNAPKAGIPNMNIQQAQPLSTGGQQSYQPAQTQSMGAIPKFQMTEAQALPSAQNTLMGLLGMVGKPQQQPRPGQAYQNPYVSSLMQV